MKNTKSIGFFKRLKTAIFGLENYIEFTAENFRKSLGFMIKMILILSLVLVVSNVMYIYTRYQGLTNYIDSIVPNFTYENNELIIDENDKKDDNKKVIAQLMEQFHATYGEVLTEQKVSKSDVLNYITQNENNLMLVMSVFIFFGELLDLFIFWLMVALITSLVGMIILTFSRIKMKYSKLLSLSIYASTLTVILTVLYTILNIYFNIYIEIFDYLSLLIAYIYITAVIYMIKSDLIKQQLELIKIATVQAQVKEQMKKEEDEGINKDGKKPKDDDSSNDDKDEGKTEENDNKMPDEPDGSEI